MEFLDELEIFSDIKEEIKLQIKCFHVFGETNKSVLFITSDDNVFSLENKIYGWGRNNYGQLGRGYCSEENIFKPECNSSIESLKIKEISCGLYHCLVLTTEGDVYGWGDNSRGQIGCENERVITKPKIIEFKLNGIKIKSIFCGFYQSFALTDNGLVYVWGWNQSNVLGLEIEENECIFKPQLILDLFNIKSIAPSHKNTYFLTNEGFIYFCGQMREQFNESKRLRLENQKTPKLLNNELKYNSLDSITNYRNSEMTAMSVYQNNVHILKPNLIGVTKCRNLLEFCSTYLLTTHQTIGLKIDSNFFKVSDKTNPKLKYILNERIVFIKQDMRQMIRFIHIFKRWNYFNVLFITSDNKVYGFGRNSYGCLGLGHNNYVREPQIIFELCYKQINQFFIGSNFVLSMSSDNKLYGWGKNDRGQLGRGYVSDWDVYLKPEIITFEGSIKEISCGFNHCFILTTDGNFYGWGNNSNGEVGCGLQYGLRISKPIKLEVFNKLNIS